MQVSLRTAMNDDAAPLGSIVFEGFKAISSKHNFPWDLPSPEVATTLVGSLLANEGFYGVVAEQGGRAVGSNFLDLRNSIAGIGPITVDPEVQDRSIGRQLMEAVLEKAREVEAPGIRLVQAAYHNRSLALYTKLGFDCREQLSKFYGTPPQISLEGYHVRAATEADVDACNAVCVRVHGHDREGELRDSIAQGTARVVEHLGRVSGYASDIAFFGHAVGETNSEIKALIGSTREIGGGGFLVPTRNGDLMRWCLNNGLQIVHQLTLMTIGLYNEPQGAWIPSVLY
ncbi:MAG: GNAT family N-acetyltransferase [Alphaproteobacteria bacterium]